MVKNDGILFLRDPGGRDVTSTVPRVHFPWGMGAFASFGSRIPPDPSKILAAQAVETGKMVFTQKCLDSMLLKTGVSTGKQLLSLGVNTTVSTAY